MKLLFKFTIFCYNAISRNFLKDKNFVKSQHEVILPLRKIIGWRIG